jgi:radical SAM superfamily enzyme YgiQ (UPF0313 family)
MIHGTQPIPIIPPLGLALIAAVIKTAKHDVIAIDAIAEAPNQFQDEDIPLYINYSKIKGFKLISMGLSFDEISQKIPLDIDVIAISSMFSINWPLDRALMNFLSKKFPNAFFVSGGESTTGMAAQCLKQVPALKACVLGEGEETIVDLLSAIELGRDLSEVQGIIFKNSSHEIIKNAPRPRIKNINDVPFPAWEYLPIENYQKHQINPDEEPRITLSIMATRGCPYTCTFCTSPDMWGTRYYMRTPENVIAEIEYVKENFGATNFEFFDLTAIIKKDWIIAFSKLLIEKNLGITWKIPAGTRSEAIDAEVAYYLKKSGCYFITYAPESGSPRLLKLIKKKVSLKGIMQSVTDSKSEGMIVYLNMILGLPDETHSDILKTLVFMAKAKLAGVDDMPLAVFRPYPGSALFDRLVKEGQLDVDKDDYVVDSLFIIDSLKEQQIYNKSVSKFWYKIYVPLAYASFYGIELLLKPIKGLKSIRKLLANNIDSELKRKLTRKKVNFKSQNIKNVESV